MLFVNPHTLSLLIERQMLQDRIDLINSLVLSQRWCIEVRETTYIGEGELGIFSLIFLSSGGHVADVEGRIIMPPHCDAYTSNTCFCYGERMMIEALEPICYVNHSCDPTCYLDEYEDDGKTILGLFVEDGVELTPGMEITIDYQWDTDEPVPCKCGSANCRGWLGGPPTPLGVDLNSGEVVYSLDDVTTETVTGVYDHFPKVVPHPPAPEQPEPFTEEELDYAVEVAKAASRGETQAPPPPTKPPECRDCVIHRREDGRLYHEKDCPVLPDRRVPKATPKSPDPCPYDTDGDGDCHKCHRVGECYYEEHMDASSIYRDWQDNRYILSTRQVKSLSKVLVSRDELPRIRVVDTDNPDQKVDTQIEIWSDRLRQVHRFDWQISEGKWLQLDTGT